MSKRHTNFEEELFNNYLLSIFDALGTENTAENKQR